MLTPIIEQVKERLVKWLDSMRDYATHAVSYYRLAIVKDGTVTVTDYDLKQLPSELDRLATREWDSVYLIACSISDMSHAVIAAATATGTCPATLALDNLPVSMATEPITRPAVFYGPLTDNTVIVK